MPMSKRPFRWGGSGHAWVDQARDRVELHSPGLFARGVGTNCVRAGSFHRPSNSRSATTGSASGSCRSFHSLGFKLKVGNQFIDLKGKIETYRVEQVNGPWLWLYSTQLNGWALADHVVPVEQAIEFFTNYIRSYPGDAYGYTMRAIVWREERKELDIALADCNEAIRLDPTNAYVYNNRGWAWSDKKEYDKAIADYSEAIRFNPKHVRANAYIGRGLAWGYKKEYDKAINDYTEAIRLDPKGALAYNNRAWLWSTCTDAKYRDGKQAVQSAMTACELSEWKEPNTVGILAAAYAEVGDFDSAVKWQSKAIGLQRDEKTKEDYRTRLKLYQEKQKPYRETNP